jgi:hypothetical protein
MAASLQIAPGKLTIEALERMFRQLSGREMTAQERESAVARLRARDSKGFDANQPRDDGGRWTSAGTSDGDWDDDDEIANYDASNTDVEEPATDFMKKNKVSATRARLIAGAPTDAHVKIQKGMHRGGIRVIVSGTDPQAGKYVMSRNIFERQEGMVLENYMFDVENSGTGFGTNAFAQQVAHAEKQGIQKIEVHAVGGGGPGMNGHYTWPRLGFDTEIRSVGGRDRAHRDEIRAYADKHSLSRVSDFMRSAEHRDWWKNNGSSFDGEFDLSKDSLSRRVLDGYVSAKQARGGAGGKSRLGLRGRSDPRRGLGRDQIKYDPDQPRDESGRWTGGGGSGGSSGGSGSSGEGSGSGGESGSSGGSEGSSGAASDAELSSDRLFQPEELTLPVKAPPQAKATKEELYEQAKAEKPLFDKGLNTGQGVDKALGADVVRPTSDEEFRKAIETPGPTVIIGGLKGEKRATEKVENKYGGDWTKLTDVMRATVAVDNKADIKGAVDALRKEMADHGWTMANKPDNRIENPTSAGYRDLNLLFKSSTGHVAEVQVNTKAMMRAKQGDGHKLYEEYRSLEEPIKFGGRQPTEAETARLNELSQKMSALYKTAWES